MFSCNRFNGQKNIFYHFSAFAPIVKKSRHWLGSKSKKHCFLLGSKAKTTFSISGLTIEKTWTVLLQRSTAQKLSEVLRVEESVSTCAFVKHELKGVLKYRGKNLDPSLSPSCDTHGWTVGIISSTV